MDSNEHRAFLALISEDPERTFAVGIAIGRIIKPGAFIALMGELGAGKTTLVQGIAEGMGVPAAYTVASPTFALINEYPGKTARLYHIDVYRLSGSAAFLETGFDQKDYENGVTVVEWADKIADIIPPGADFITLQYVNASKRKIHISTEDKNILSEMEALGFKIIAKGGYHDRWL
jgi:tRNA threonylcarbamoyladenosine biosynthesis protein TsaE